jgi:lysophospholipase L1-like esterase
MKKTILFLLFCFLLAGNLSAVPEIVSITLNYDSHIENKEQTIGVTVYTMLIGDDEKLKISFVDENDNEIVGPIDADPVVNNRTRRALIIPASVPAGKYAVKVAAPNGKIGDVEVSPKKAEYLIVTSFFTGKNLITFGNSITASSNSWAYQIHKKLGFGNLYNGAVGGAIWYKRARIAQNGDSIWTQDYADPDFAGMSNETNSSAEAFQRIINNCAVVHIQKYLLEKPDASPDYAILSYGTNDAASVVGSFGETMSRELDKVNLFTMAGALRWSIETLRTRFPKLTIYVALPIQAKDADKNSGNEKKIKFITGICNALSVTYFDCYNESGITVENQAEYLRDGLHPNEAGQALHAKYIMKKLEEAAKSQSVVIQEDVHNECISISGNVLKTSQSLVIRSLVDDASLAEMTLYGMAGNTVCRKSVSGHEFTFNVPAVAGMYLLTVRLTDNTSKEFKILVK